MNRSPETRCYSGLRTGMARAVLVEIAVRLQALAADGTGSAIDLRSLPLTEADRDELSALLGRGEVRATVQVLGDTEIQETAYAGVWWIRHLGGQGLAVAEEIAITPVPEILHSQAEDIECAAARLRAELEPSNPEQGVQEAVHG